MKPTRAKDFLVAASIFTPSLARAGSTLEINT